LSEITCNYAKERLEFVKGVRNNGNRLNNSTYSEDILNVCDNGHLECLKYCHENNCPWDNQTCRYAAIYGNLECLKYARDNGCPEWTTYP
jgi:hypothetical protein